MEPKMVIKHQGTACLEMVLLDPDIFYLFMIRNIRVLQDEYFARKPLT
jgi:hypothetical protein